MLKALLKKQFLELSTFYFQNKKSGKNRSKAGIFGFTILMLLAFCLVGLLFYEVGAVLSIPLSGKGLDWLYFAIMGMLSIFLGVFGSVFNTYAGLYRSKDNELLLSMPIPPSKILFSRIVGVYVTGLLYECLVLVPALLAYWINAEASAVSIAFSVLQIFIIGFFILSLTCAFGWIVALISKKLKGKSFVTVVASLLFLAVYYFVYLQANKYIRMIVQHADKIGDTIKSGFYPIYLMGRAFTGEILPLLAVTAISALLAITAYLILSRTFVKFSTATGTTKKSVYKNQKLKSTDVKKALFLKELKRFTSCPTYMLNSGLGIFAMPVVAVFAIIKAETIREMIEIMVSENPLLYELLPVAAVGIICLMLAMNTLTAPSISLEGKNIWILQSLPINSADILKAKLKLHLVFNAPIAVLCSIIFGIIIESNILTILVMSIFSVGFVFLSAVAGLAINLKKPNIDWTNETVPIKQSISVLFTLFGGWLVVAIFGLLSAFAILFINMSIYIFAFAVLIIAVSLLIYKWIITKGAKIFTKLS